MGYFSNGSEGADYAARWCKRCVHYMGCAVWLAHKLHNGDEGAEEVIDLLIPRTADGLGNEQCRMFVPDPRGGEG